MQGRLAVAWVAVMLLSCVHRGGPTVTRRDFFVAAQPDNPWNRKIENWQKRHERDESVRRPEATPTTAELGEAYEAFTVEMRRRVVEETVHWVQEQSRRFYRSDGEYDHWATLGDVIRTGGDDCDGLDLLTFVLLRRLGFRQSEIYRAIVVERSSGQHHMVTLWFRDGASSSDPLVLDPTGVVSREVVSLSSVPDWDPIELFDERVHFAVQKRAVSDVASQH